MTFTETFTLPADSSERLFVVADALERHPEQWDQSDFIQTGSWDDNDGVCDHAGTGVPIDCGTRLCTAGWAVVMTPKDELEGFHSWEEAGRAALGFDAALGEFLFYQIGDNSDGSRAAIRNIMPDVLRALAGLPEVRRTFDNPRVQEILAPFRALDA